MARYPVQGVFKSGNGPIISGGTITPYVAGTTTAITAYAAASGGTAINSTTSDTNGDWIFYLDVADYPTGVVIDIVLSASGYNNTTYHNYNPFMVDLSATQTLTNKTLTSPSIGGTVGGSATYTTPTLTSPVLNTGVSGTAIDDTSTLGTSTTKLPTQNAVKHYADRVAKVSAQRVLAAQIFS